MTFFSLLQILSEKVLTLDKKDTKFFFFSIHPHNQQKMLNYWLSQKFKLLGYDKFNHLTTYFWHKIIELLFVFGNIKQQINRIWKPTIRADLLVPPSLEVSATPLNSAFDAAKRSIRMKRTTEVMNFLEAIVFAHWSLWNGVYYIYNWRAVPCLSSSYLSFKSSLNEFSRIFNVFLVQDSRLKCTWKTIRLNQDKNNWTPRSPIKLISLYHI